jgi:exocyst complex protein 7
VSAHSGSPADETAIITRGPDMMALSEYITAINSVRDDLERMDSAGSRAREAGIRDLVRGCLVAIVRS